MALTIVTEREITDNAGVGASTDITLSSAWLIAIGERAESQVCVDTNVDWISGWSGVNNKIKGLVSNTTAAWAAREIVKYSSRNYVNQGEQETILDVLTDQYNKGIKELEKKDDNTLRSVG